MPRLLGLVMLCLVCGCARASAAPPPPEARPAASPVPAPVAARPARLQELAADNPNIQQQYATWRESRVRQGQDPGDYAAFRRHLLRLGAPDPGEAELADFAAASLSPVDGRW